MKEHFMKEDNVHVSLSHQLERIESMFHLLAEMMGELRSTIFHIAETTDSSTPPTPTVAPAPPVGADLCVRPETTTPRQAETSPVDAGGFNPPLPVVQVSEFLQQRYEFRYNQLTGQTEYRARTALSETSSPFLPVCPRAKSTFYYEVQVAGIFCYESQIQCVLNSFLIQPYHPFREYLDNLPVWDGTDRINALATRVSTDPLWRTGFRRWMLGMAAGWLGVNPQYANSLAPLLVSREQGLHKSTFCRMLLPPELERFYTDSFPLTNIPLAERRLSEYGLISLDKFDRHSSRHQADLKNLMQATTLHLRRARQQYETTLPRIASFIGTSNCKELLTDKTGSRRFLCVEVTHMIDTDTPLEYAQLYAQLKYLVTTAAEQYWPTEEEKAAIEQHNLSFYKTSVEENFF